MNKFRFRIWDDDEKRMIYNEELDSCDTYFHYYHFFDKDGLTFSKTAPNGCGVDFTKIMLGSGVKDKNKKEIYSGDLVKYTCFDKEYIGHIIIKNGAFVFEGNYNNTNFVVATLFDLLKKQLIVSDIINTIEIIGNQFEGEKNV